MPSTRNYYFFLIVITLMSSVNLVATDVYLPALPDMAVHFNCSQSEIQLSFTVYLLGLAGCQLVAGMLSDRFGRKNVVVLGFSVFIIASVLCAGATTLSQFIAFRMLQAMGGGVGSVISRALVVDRYDRQGAVKIFSTIFPIVGLSSAIGPSIGGYITYFWGWQTIFYFIAVFGVIILIFAAYCLQGENIRKPVTDPKTVILQQAYGYWGIIGNIEFLAYAFIISTSFAVFRSYAAESPFVFTNQGYLVEEIGNFYFLLSLAYIAGNLFAKKLINHKSVTQVLRVGILVSVCGGGLLVVATHLFGESPLAVILPMTVITMGNGFLFPVASAGAMTAVRGEFAGMASGLMGALQFVLAAICINWVGDWCHGEAVNMSLFVGFIILMGLGCYLLLVMKKPRPSIPLT